MTPNFVGCPFCLLPSAFCLLLPPPPSPLPRNGGEGTIYFLFPRFTPFHLFATCEKMAAGHLSPARVVPAGCDAAAEVPRRLAAVSEAAAGEITRERRPGGGDHGKGRTA